MRHGLRPGSPGAREGTVGTVGIEDAWLRKDSCRDLGASRVSRAAERTVAADVPDEPEASKRRFGTAAVRTGEAGRQHIGH